MLLLFVNDFLHADSLRLAPKEYHELLHADAAQVKRLDSGFIREFIVIRSPTEFDCARIIVLGLNLTPTAITYFENQNTYLLKLRRSHPAREYHEISYKAR